MNPKRHWGGILHGFCKGSGRPRGIVRYALLCLILPIMPSQAQEKETNEPTDTGTLKIGKVFFAQQHVQEPGDRFFKRLLLETDRPIVELGKRVGFRSPNYLFQRFRETFGMSPAEFRDQNS